MFLYHEKYNFERDCNFDILKSIINSIVLYYSKSLRTIVEEQLSYYLVLPHRIPIPLANNVDFALLKYPLPQVAPFCQIVFCQWIVYHFLKSVYQLQQILIALNDQNDFVLIDLLIIVIVVMMFCNKTRVWWDLRLSRLKISNAQIQKFLGKEANQIHTAKL